MERAPSNTALAESTVLDVQGINVIQPIRESGRMIDQLSGQMVEINSQLNTDAQRTTLSSA